MEKLKYSLTHHEINERSVREEQRGCQVVPALGSGDKNI